MAAFSTWDIIKVPFPYTDRPVRQRRPALVIAASGVLEQHGLLWVVMITSAENRGWANDVDVSDLAAAGLPAPSVVRVAKVATIEAKEAERMGSLPASDRRHVSRHLSAELGGHATTLPQE